MAREILLSEVSLNFISTEDNFLKYDSQEILNLEENVEYTIFWNDIQFTCTSYLYSEDIVIGNLSIVLSDSENTNEPFLIIKSELGFSISTPNTSESSNKIAIYRDYTSGITIKNPLGKTVAYGEYNNVLLSTTSGEKIVYSKLPQVTTENNGKILGVKDGIWSIVDGPENSEGGNCSCPTSTIEKDIMVNWEFTQDTIDNSIEIIPEESVNLYKLVDATPTKEQILSGEFVGHLLGQSMIFNFNVLHEEEGYLILRDENFFFPFLVFYKTGDHVISFEGMEIPVSIPSVGVFLMFSAYDAPMLIGAYGHFSYTIIEEVNFVQSDWNQSDFTKPDYVRNRPFYDQEKKIPVIEKQTQIFAVDAPLYDSTVTGFTYMDEYSSYGVKFSPAPFILEEGIYYEITWNNEIFNCKSFVFDGKVGVGNGSNVGQEPNELPFLLVYADDTISVLSTNADDCSLRVRSANCGWGEPTDVILTEGQQYKVVFNNEFYEGVPSVATDTWGSIYYFGNSHLFGIDWEDTGESFFIGITSFSDNSQQPTLFVISIEYTENYENTFEVYQTELEARKIDPIYLPDDIKLPTITPDTDEGKFLRVVGGVATWATIPNAEEAEF